MFVANERPDGFVEHPFTTNNSHSKYGIIALLECKNTKGRSGDPNVQIIFDYAKLAQKMISKDVKDVGGFVPTLLLTLAGSTLSVGIGWFGERFGQCIIYWLQKGLNAQNLNKLLC